MERFAKGNEYFSELQFLFREGVGCIDASFTILETINQILERGSKVISCFLDVNKAFDTVWIDGSLYQLFSELGIKCRMWLAIKGLYTMSKQKYYIQGHCQEKLLFRKVQDKEEFLAPFMYKVYINSFLKALSNRCYAISIKSVSLLSPSFGDNISLPALYVSFLETFINICHKYGIKWRYEVNHTKSKVVTFGEIKPLHSKSMKEREWMLGDAIVNELSAYKNLGILKN